MPPRRRGRIDQNRPVKTTSCGILILNPERELLLCHVTGGSFWDIPKGGVDPGESAVETAIRETVEETGLVFSPADLHDLGRFTYRPVKDLHLFATLLERVDTRRCHCRTHFHDRHGISRPEMDGFAWVPLATVPRRCARRMGELLSTGIALPALFDQLLAAAFPVKRAEFALRG